MWKISSVIDGIRKKMETDDTGMPYMPEFGGVCKEITKENLKRISARDYMCKIAFVDGGNAEVFLTPSISIHMIRVYCSIFENKKRKFRKKIECISATFSNYSDELIYEINLFPLSRLPDDFKLKNSWKIKSSEIQKMDIRYEISAIGVEVRKFLEWKMADYVSNYLDDDDIIVMDGSLYAPGPIESHYAEEFISKSKFIIGGVSKTCSLITTSGVPVLVAVRELARRFGIDDSAWYYFPLASSNNRKTGVAKFHRMSTHVFRMDIIGDEIEKFASAVANHSKDVAFIGYPYGLIDADRNARVTNAEQKVLSSLIVNSLSSCMDDSEKISMHLSALDAHERLNLL